MRDVTTDKWANKNGSTVWGERWTKASNITKMKVIRPGYTINVSFKWKGAVKDDPQVPNLMRRRNGGTINGTTGPRVSTYKKYFSLTAIKF